MKTFDEFSDLLFIVVRTEPKMKSQFLFFFFTPKEKVFSAKFNHSLCIIPEIREISTLDVRGLSCAVSHTGNRARKTSGAQGKKSPKSKKKRYGHPPIEMRH